MDRVRMGIVGCGNISQLNLRGYVQHPRAEIVALCDVDEQRARRRAEQFSIQPRIYTEYLALLDDDEVDAIELLTPTYQHAEQIIAALTKGKHVSCQKPITTDLARVDQIAAAVSKSTKTFRVTENFYYYPPILKAKSLLDEGAIGQPSMVRIHTSRAAKLTHLAVERNADAQAWRSDPTRNPGGVLFDDAVHKYATAMLWVDDIDQVSAMVTQSDDFINEMPSAVICRFKSTSCIGIIDYSYHSKMMLRGRYVMADELFEIHGESGTIWVTRCQGELHNMPPVMLMDGQRTIEFDVASDYALSFDGAAYDFVDSLLEGRQPKQDLDTARKVLQIPFAIYESARSGRTVATDSMA